MISSIKVMVTAYKFTIAVQKLALIPPLGVKVGGNFKSNGVESPLDYKCFDLKMGSLLKRRIVKWEIPLNL